jgi:hypothetical protein
MRIRRLPAGPRLAAALVLTIAVTTCGDNASNAPAIAPLEIKTLSNRADLVSGGDVLVEIVLPPGSPETGLHVTVGTDDVSSRFSRGPDGRILGLVTGLPDSPTAIIADLGGKGAAMLTITNHEIGGPVFSGPQITPWICAGPAPIAEVGDTPAVSHSGLAGTAGTDGQCNIATEMKLYYRTTANPPACTTGLPDPVQPLANEVNPPGKITDLPPPRPAPTNGCFKPYDPALPPSDLRMTTTDTGVTVPYIVRVERGTLNRGIYDLAVLYDPTQVGGEGWKSTAPPTTWNRKLLYVFGPSTGQPRRQQRSSQAWTAQDEALRRGFLVAVNSMTDSALNSNRVTMTETVMMMKEHIIDTYGELRYAIGAGCSGGSINQLLTASIYPGLLDGIQPSCTYPDSETTAIEVADCEALVRVYASTAWNDLLAREGLTGSNADKQAAINGHLDYLGCRSWFNAFTAVARPGNFRRDTVNLLPRAAITTAIDKTNNCTLPPSMVYDPEVPGSTGVRCAGQDFAVSVWGKAEGTDRATSTRDNVGVVYGLEAFLDDKITAEELVTVNETIGGADADLKHTAARSAADPAALDVAYRSGIVMDGPHLARTPIIDVRGYDEPGIHHTWRSYSLRARLDHANGGHGNHVLWQFSKGMASSDLIPSLESGLTVAAFDVMDKWLGAMNSASPIGPIEHRVLAARPAEGFDFCYLTSDATFATKVTDPAICNADSRLMPHRSPRQVAGGPIDENILKCQRKPFNANDYPGLTPEQRARLQVAFPDGVCDWSKPGVGQTAASSPLDFGTGPGPGALQAAPTSQPL